jgi:hypothetical protein
MWILSPRPYGEANCYLEQHFIADCNRRFTVKPAQPESALSKLGGIELELVLSSKYQRTVHKAIPSPSKT